MGLGGGGVNPILWDSTGEITPGRGLNNLMVCC